MAEHEWQEIMFSWGGLIECTCGYRPQSLAQMDTHSGGEEDNRG